MKFVIKALTSEKRSITDTIYHNVVRIRFDSYHY